MGNRVISSVVAGLLVLMGVSAVEADEVGSSAEARVLSKRAMDAVFRIGSQAAFTQFADPKGGYQVKDLYVFCMDKDGVMLSHGKDAELVGKNLLGFNEYGDKPFQYMINLARTTREGWISYRWPYPGSGEVKSKTSYITSHPAGFFCGVGAYN